RPPPRTVSASITATKPPIERSFSKRGPVACGAITGFVSASFSVSPLAGSAFFALAGRPAALGGTALGGGALAAVKVRPLALGEAGCGPLAFSTPSEGPAKRRPLPSGTLVGGATIGRLLPKTTVAGSGASGLRCARPAAGAAPPDVLSPDAARLRDPAARRPSAAGRLPARLRGDVVPGLRGGFSLCSVIVSAAEPYLIARSSRCGPGALAGPKARR